MWQNNHSGIGHQTSVIKSVDFVYTHLSIEFFAVEMTFDFNHNEPTGYGSEKKG